MSPGSCFGQTASSFVSTPGTVDKFGTGGALSGASSVPDLSDASVLLRDHLHELLKGGEAGLCKLCLLYTSPSPRD